MSATPLPEKSFLPDFCRGRAVLQLLLISQLVAFVIVLTAPGNDFLFGTRLVVVSLYLHWIMLLSAAVLCYLRRFFLRMRLSLTVALSFLTLLGITLVISEAAYWVGRSLNWPEFVGPYKHALFLTRNVLVCGIVSALILRYFYVIHAWRRQVEASAEARYAALQARIRPHFLFNSLNSVVALIPSRPEEAEELVEDLAELFRAILRTHEPWGPLEQELRLAKTYLRIEALRLGERLQVDWQVEDGLQQARIPLLSLQPLVENAVYHGVERLEDGGVIQVSIWQEEQALNVRVVNPVPTELQESHGSQIAHENIRQRLLLLYDGRASFSTRCKKGEYSAELSVPV